MSPRNLAVLAAATAAIVLGLTSPAIPIVWDEGEYLHRAGEIGAWVRLIFDRGNPDGGLSAFSANTIAKHWMFVSQFEGHPAWGVVPMAITGAAFGKVLHPLTAARLGTVLVFSAACGLVAYRLRKLSGTVAAVIAVTALLTFPRIFAEAHFATLDAPLTAWWLILWVADASMSSSVAATVSVGVVAGLTSATKFTGWLAWVPLAASRALRFRVRDWLKSLLIVPIGLVTFCLVNPSTWHHVRSTLQTHFQLNLSRATLMNIPGTFLGATYDLNHPLPWYNTIVWLLIVTPVPLLIVGSIGLFHCLRLRAGIPGVSLCLHWATLMVVRALPWAPPHDGIRLFLPAFGFWCVLSGVGAQQLWDRSHSWSRRAGALARAVLVVALIAGAINLARYYPQTLSHYNLLVGGVRGAARIGMEPTYWWDGLDNEALTWLNTHTGDGERIAFSRSVNISLLRSWGRLKPVQAPVGGVFKWYVLQNRTSMLGPGDRALIETVKPAFAKFAGRHPAGTAVPADLNVPLILVFSYEDFRKAWNIR